MMKQTYQLSKEDFNEIKELIVNNAQLKVKIQEIEDKVYQKYEIHNRSEFENYVQNIQSKDAMIKETSDYIKKCYKMSIEGEPFIIAINYPEEITPEFVFEVKKNLTKNELEEFVKFCIEYEN